MDANDRTKFIKILGLLGSDQDGERASAALMASKFLAKRSLTWSDVVSGSASGGQNSSNGSANNRRQHQYKKRPNEQTNQGGQGYERANAHALYFRKVNWLRQNAYDLMSNWEKDFIESVIVRNVPLSYKQRVVVDGIIEKAKAFGREFT